MSYLQAIVIGLLQCVTELFPISSLGHSVLVPAWLGWESSRQRPIGKRVVLYLAFVVALHVATALALLVYFREDWVRIIRAFFHTLRSRKLETPDERLAWLLIVATIPAGITGLALEHALRTLFAKPLAAAIFLTRERRHPVRRRAGAASIRSPQARDRTPRLRTATARKVERLDTLEFKEAGAVGRPRRWEPSSPASAGRASRWSPDSCAVSTTRTRPASRSCWPRRSSSPRVSTRSPTWRGHLGNGIRGQALVGSIFAALAAYASIRFLMRFF